MRSRLIPGWGRKVCLLRTRKSSASYWPAEGRRGKKLRLRNKWRTGMRRWKINWKRTGKKKRSTMRACPKTHPLTSSFSWALSKTSYTSTPNCPPLRNPFTSPSTSPTTTLPNLATNPTHSTIHLKTNPNASSLPNHNPFTIAVKSNANCPYNNCSRSKSLRRRFTWGRYTSRAKLRGTSG